MFREILRMWRSEHFRRGFVEGLAYPFLLLWRYRRTVLWFAFAVVTAVVHLRACNG